MKNIIIKDTQIIGFGDNYNCNPNYANNLIEIFPEMENPESIYHSQNEYNSPIYFSTDLTYENFAENEILKKETLTIVGEYKHKKIFLNKKEIEVAFILNNNKKVVFMAYSYNEMHANILYPQKEDVVIISDERKLIKYIEYLYS